ncbi:hypothetical protein H1C71_014246, partial [Ictidomys tridecemlineatus]
KPCRFKQQLLYFNSHWHCTRAFPTPPPMRPFQNPHTHRKSLLRHFPIQLELSRNPLENSKVARELQSSEHPRQQERPPLPDSKGQIYNTINPTSQQLYIA